MAEKKMAESVVESVVAGVSAERPVEAWACPNCSDPVYGEEVLLVFDPAMGSYPWSCPRCGCVSASPEDDGAWRVVPAEC